VSAFHVKEMAWCAAFQLGRYGACPEGFRLGVLPRCGVCPLFDSERAIRAGLPQEQAFEAQSVIDTDDSDIDGVTLVLSPEVIALLARELPDWLDLTRLFPDQPPREWTEPEGDAPSG
jgi:hypothetical protein